MSWNKEKINFIAWMLVVTSISLWNLIVNIPNNRFSDWMLHQDEYYELKRLTAENRKDIINLYGWRLREVTEDAKDKIEFEKFKNHKHRYHDGAVIPR